MVAIIMLIAGGILGFIFGIMWHKITSHDITSEDPKTPGSYATGGDMDQEQKDRMKKSFKIGNMEFHNPHFEFQPREEQNERTKSWFDHEETKEEARKFGERMKGFGITNEPKFIVDNQKSSTLYPPGEPMFWDGSKLNPIVNSTRMNDIPPPSDINSGTYRFKMPVANMTQEKIEDFKSRLDASLNGNNKPGIFLWPKNTGFTKLRNRGSRFLPSSNPLGDTAAFMMKTGYPYYEFFNGETHHREPRSFRHRKGGRRV